MKQIKYKLTFRKHRDKVFGFAFYLLRNQEDAEDVTQEVFVNLWRHWTNIDQEKVEAWIMKSTRNRCVDVIRKRQTPLSKVYSADWNLISDAGEAPASPHEQLELTETQDSILHAIYTLPEKIQSILLLHYFMDLKLSTIGEVLGVNLSTVKVSLHRGRKMLKETLKARYPDVLEGIA
ncbi:sigma-70 family RNA polymerase sigma factor [bacterium]|nr:sigma-70 family RNA polymerase sigma factor [bacterium]